MLTDDGRLNWQEVMKRLNHWVRHRVHHAADADELVQDILERLLVHQDSLAEVDNPVGWVHRVATNAIVDYYRRSSKRQMWLDELSVPETSPEISDDRKDARAELSDCLSPLVMNLDSRSREALLSTDLGGKSQVDAAQEAGIPLSTMKARVQRGRRKLRLRLLQCCHVALDCRNRVIDFESRGTKNSEQESCCNAD